MRNANQARRLLIEAGFDERFADVPLEEFPWHCLTPEVAARLSEPCTPSSDISTFISPDDFP